MTDIYKLLPFKTYVPGKMKNDFKLVSDQFIFMINDKKLEEVCKFCIKFIFNNDKYPEHKNFKLEKGLYYILEEDPVRWTIVNSDNKNYVIDMLYIYIEDLLDRDFMKHCYGKLNIDYLISKSDKKSGSKKIWPILRNFIKMQIPLLFQSF